jgi:TatD DNase family protein
VLVNAGGVEPDMLELYDIHAHLADPRMAGEAESILTGSRAHGLRGVLVNAARTGEWAAVAELATRPGVCGALGLHPFFLDEWDDALPERLRAMLAAAMEGRKDGKTEAPGADDCGLRAVGEIGIDLWECEDRGGALARQIPALEAQLAVACGLRLPAILHNRKAWPEFFAVWRRLAAGVIPGVCHHFTGGREILREALDLGLYVSFCGPITYGNARRIREAAAFAPLDRILTETDAPDLPAAPFRGGRSEPWHVSFVLAEIARVRRIPEAEVTAAVAANYHRVLGLPPD